MDHQMGEARNPLAGSIPAGASSWSFEWDGSTPANPAGVRKTICASHRGRLIDDAIIREGVDCRNLSWKATTIHAALQSRGTSSVHYLQPVKLGSIPLSVPLKVILSIRFLLPYLG